MTWDTAVGVNLRRNYARERAGRACVRLSAGKGAAVKSGFFGSYVSLVPLATADLASEDLRVPYTKDQLQGAPHQDPDGALSPSEEAKLFEHYGVSYGGDTVTAQGGGTGLASTSCVTRPVGERDTGGHDASGLNTDQAMTHSEERLDKGATVPCASCESRNRPKPFFRILNSGNPTACTATSPAVSATRPPRVTGAGGLRCHRDVSRTPTPRPTSDCGRVGLGQPLHHARARRS